MKKQTVTKIYYGVLILMLLTKVGMTIFSNGLAVHHGKKIAQLQVQKNNLLTQQVKLTSELSEKSSIATITETYDIGNFIPILNPIILTNSSTVASN